MGDHEKRLAGLKELKELFHKLVDEKFWGEIKVLLKGGHVTDIKKTESIKPKK